MERNNYKVLNVKRKNRWKFIRSIMQGVIVLLLSIVLIKTVFLLDKHESSASEGVNDKGFIALTYFGVSRDDSPKYVSRKNLDKQLSRLATQGYETITQQDIIDFYENDKKLPEKALYLSFEDGRTDSSIFSQEVLEKLNYKATMFTYSNKMDTKDSKFLKPNHLKTMEKSNYWELGSNGHRLTYINVYNDQGESLGMIDENEVPDKMSIEYYNHYLMDFLRDPYMVPVETRSEMEERIATDYHLMNEIYLDSLGEMPKAYAIMHGNALYNNMDPLVEKENDQQLRSFFQLHFNREGIAYNQQKDDPYNLSRLQVSPYWPTNHLMMKIQASTKEQIEFEIGDPNKAKDWRVTNGAAEFIENEIILTSAPGKESILTLKEPAQPNYKLEFAFNGHVVGEQSVFLRYDEKENTYIRMMLKDNALIFSEKKSGKKERVIHREQLPDVEWSGEDSAFNKATVYTYRDTQLGSRIDEEEYPRNLSKRRQFSVDVGEKKLQVVVDGQQEIEVEIDLEKTGRDQLAFGAHYSKKNTSHEQYADNIYDTVIENIKITADEEEVVYSNQYTKLEKMKYETTKLFSQVVNYFIENF